MSKYKMICLDIDMIKYSGMAIAMGNDPDEVKQYADAIPFLMRKIGLQRQ